MAGVKFDAVSGEVALVAATAKTVLMLTAAANHRALADGIEVSFKGIVTTDTPVRVRIGRTSTAGTPGAGATIVKRHEGDNETIQTTVGGNFSAEPTYTDIHKVWEIHPQTGLVVFLPFSKEIPIIGSSRLAVECLAAQAQTVAVNLSGEE